MYYSPAIPLTRPSTDPLLHALTLTLTATVTVMGPLLLPFPFFLPRAGTFPARPRPPRQMCPSNKQAGTLPKPNDQQAQQTSTLRRHPPTVPIPVPPSPPYYYYFAGDAVLIHSTRIWKSDRRPCLVQASIQRSVSALSCIAAPAGCGYPPPRHRRSSTDQEVVPLPSDELMAFSIDQAGLWL